MKMWKFNKDRDFVRFASAIEWLSAVNAATPVGGKSELYFIKDRGYAARIRDAVGTVLCWICWDKRANL